MLVRRALCTTTLALLAVAGLACQGSDPPDPQPPSQQQTSVPPAAKTRGCQERIEGPKVPVQPTRDTRIGPVTFPNLPSAYDDARRTFRQTGKSDPMKVIATVDAGRDPTLVVPSSSDPGFSFDSEPFNVARTQSP